MTDAERLTVARRSSPASPMEQAPILVFWETTRACELACRHCRAEAVSEPGAGELSTREAEQLIERIASFEPRRPVLVLTGGDVMMRRDLFELVSLARGAGLTVALAPSVTDRLTREALVSLRALGVSSVSISLDGASARTHEGIRGIPGHFEQTMRVLAELRDLGFSVQVNTAAMADNVDELADVARIVADAGASSWEVFFLVKVGRGKGAGELTPAQNEDVAHFLFNASRYGFTVRTVEGPWLRRVAAWRKGGVEDADAGAEFGLGPTFLQLSQRLIELMGPPTSSPRCGTAGTRDGKGILFVSHDGRVFPAGFLPIRLGSVRIDDIVDIYRSHPLLRAIRRAEFSGRCGDCEFRDVCGGSRARAFASSGDPLGEDPGCVYSPQLTAVSSI